MSTDFAVPIPDTEAADATDVDVCPYCQRPFGAPRQRALHVGEVHADVATPGEQEVYERASADERDDLFYFHMKVVVTLGVLFATFVISYTAIVTSLG